MLTLTVFHATCFNKAFCKLLTPPPTVASLQASSAMPAHGKLGRRGAHASIPRSTQKLAGAAAKAASAAAHPVSVGFGGCIQGHLHAERHVLFRCKVPMSGPLLILWTAWPAPASYQGHAWLLPLIKGAFLINLINLCGEPPTLCWMMSQSWTSPLLCYSSSGLASS